MVIHYEEALYQVYVPLLLPLLAPDQSKIGTWFAYVIRRKSVARGGALSSVVVDVQST